MPGLFVSKVNKSSPKVFSMSFLSCLFLSNWFFAFLTKDFFGVFFYINFIVCAVIVADLSSRKSLPFVNKKLDNWLGNFSYPIYLFHYQIGLLAIVVFDSLGIKLSRPDLNLLVISLPLLFIFSWVANNVIERPIEKIRYKIKSKK